MGNLEDLEKIEKLRSLKFIGDFPKGIEVLLVPLETATEELKLIYPELTIGLLKGILNRRNIMIFSNIDQWDRFKNAETRKRSRVR